MQTKPFLKWAGGKRQLLPKLLPIVPKTFNNYFEPFLGGGALFFALKELHKIQRDAYLTDINNALINTYWSVKTEVDAVIGLLKDYSNTREEFDCARKKDTRFMTTAEQAARFIYLNRTAFNGLYRVNAKGEFNTPFGGYENPKICDIETLRAAQAALQGAKVFACNFDDLQPEKHDFCYLDPPYYPLKSTSFVSYSSGKFSVDDHERLAKYVEKLADRGVYIVLSNSYTDWVLARYKKFNILEVKARRSINSNGRGRAKISEAIITNF